MRSVCSFLLIIGLAAAGPQDCDDSVPRAPAGERGVGSDGVAYENPTPTSEGASGSKGPRVDSVTISTPVGGITIKN